MDREKLKSLPFLINALVRMQKWRVGAQVRNAHLENQERMDENTTSVFAKVLETEKFIIDLVAQTIVEHPAYSWFSRIKGIGKENIAKVVGLCDINRAPTISALWKFAGYHVVDGHAPKMVKGQKSDHNRTLRMMCWRLAESIVKNGYLHGGSHYYDFYLQELENYKQKYASQNIKIAPAAEMPKKEGKIYEPTGWISVGHVQNQAKRKMIKLFLSHLWLVWRKAENLPTRAPYVHEKLGHTTFLDPWDMLDKPAKKKRGRPPIVPSPEATA